MKNRTYQMRSISQAQAVVAVLCLPLLAIVLGCNAEIDPMLKTLDANIISAKTNDISRTMDFIYADRQFDQKDFEEKVSIGLNRWANYSAQEVNEATIDNSDLVKDLLAKFEDVEAVKRIEESSFINTDPYFLQEAFWIKQIADRVTAGEFLNIFEYYRLAADNFKPEEDDKTPVTSVVAKLHPDLDADQAKDLTKALTLFDWTVRNIYLLPELEPSDEEIEQQRLSDAKDPIAAGVRFTGTQRHPWQTLVVSRGDYVDRAKVFLMLARKAGLDAAMLTVGEDETPWAVGVAVNDQYYLFDTKLGLPVATETLGQIATLKQLKDNPKLLSNLDLTLKESLADDTKYWVSEDDLSTLAAKVYVVPESLSPRMKGLESSLVGENRLELGAFPSKQLDKLPAVDGVEKELWDVEFETYRFRQAVRQALPRSVSDDQLNDRLRWYFRDEAYIDNFHPYRTCRVRFFKGDFETLEEDLRRNAVESFQFLTYTDDQIDNIGTDKIMMSIAGLADIKDANVFDSRLRSTQQQMRLVRRDVGLFLSQCLFDNGSPGTSANWLETIVDKDDVQRWKSGVKYLLGRSYESRKEYDRAIEDYTFEDSEQIHGNLIRVRLIKAAIKKAYPAATEPETKTDQKKSEAKEPETKEPETKEPEAKDVEAKEPEASEEEAKQEPSEEVQMAEPATEEEPVVAPEESSETQESPEPTEEPELKELKEIEKPSEVEDAPATEETPTTEE
ncbi:hypothetical protein OAG71_00915 [bacterium]|nr:hypothetical protein [bacterium]